MSKPIAISDSANFYVSAERLFDPGLRGVPVIVLSNCDGCAVARSDEAKALGIKMGAPLHLIQDTIKNHGVRVFSSNYTLYGDISRRIVDVYHDFSPYVEVYSIDECFLDFSGFRDREQHAQNMRAAVLRRIGVPTRVGIGPTKTLAKVANDIAKRNPIFDGVFDLMDPKISEWILPKLAVGDVWGIGTRTRAKLKKVDIHTAADLRDMPLRQARALGSVVLERTVLELNGTSCLSLEEVEPQRKGMAVTRSTGSPMHDFDTVFEALTAHTSRLGEKLRQHGLAAGSLTALFHTNRFAKDKPQYSAQRSLTLAPPSNDTLVLLKAARRALKAAWPKSNAQPYAFTKAGVIAADLVPEDEKPRGLFDHVQTEDSALMQAVDAINARYGKTALTLGSEGTERSWKMRADYRSPRYTTRISDLPVVRR